MENKHKMLIDTYNGKRKYICIFIKATVNKIQKIKYHLRIEGD